MDITDEDDDDSEYEGGYDPDIVNKESFSWLRHLRVLGINPDAVSTNKFVSEYLSEFSFLTRF